MSLNFKIIISLIQNGVSIKENTILCFHTVFIHAIVHNYISNEYQLCICTKGKDGIGKESFITHYKKYLLLNLFILLNLIKKFTSVEFSISFEQRSCCSFVELEHSGILVSLLSILPWIMKILNHKTFLYCRDKFHYITI